jgi:DNA-binding transcriptional LysR family regulator
MKLWPSVITAGYTIRMPARQLPLKPTIGPQAALGGLLARLRARHFSLLDALGATRNLRAAAQRLHITQPAASKLLREVERMLGARLFERSRRGVAPTAIGDIAITRARRIIAEIVRIREELDVTTAGMSGVVRIGAFPIAAAVLVPHAVRWLADRAPRLKCVLQEAPPRVLLANLRQGELDFVVGRGPIDDPEIAVDPIYDQPVCVVASRDHPLARRRRIAWATAAQQRWIFPHDGPARTALESTLARAGPRLPYPVVETISPTAVEALVQHGLLALMSLDIARRLEGLGRLKVLPLRLEVALPAISLAWEASREFTPPMARFADALRAAAAELMAGGANAACAPARGRAHRAGPVRLAPTSSRR